MATAPRFPLRAAIAVALLILALVAAALYVGSQRRLPEPFGPAGNGDIVFADAAGDIYLGDPVAGTSQAVVTGPEIDSQPVYSPDGLKFAFLRKSSSSSRIDIVVANADGSNAQVITPTSLYETSSVAWTPDSGSVVVVELGKVLAFDIEQAAGPRTISEGTSVFAFRPPSGDKVLALTYEAGHPVLTVANLDGSERHVLVDQSRTDIEYTDLSSPAWSPDGSRIAFSATVDDSIADHRVFVMNGDGTGLRELRQGSLESMGCTSPCGVVYEDLPSWSPDGSRIALNRWFNTASGEWIGPRPVTIVDVATGSVREVGPSFINSFYGWQWSPDGTSILILPNGDTTPGDPNPAPGTLMIANAETGVVEEVSWKPGAPPSWQRVASD
jgi:Tol biopolymer transport system component